MAFRAFLASCLATTFAFGLAEAAAKTPIEVWTESDDGPTHRLADAIDASVRASHIFVESTGQARGTIYLNIKPADARNGYVRAKVLIAYKTQAASPLKAAYITCSEKMLGDCAIKALKLAATAVTGLGPRDRN